MDAGIFADMQQHGKFDDADLLRRVNDGSFTAIITTVPLSDPERWRYFPWRWIKPMQQRYRPADSFEWKQRHVTYYIYRPAN